MRRAAKDVGATTLRQHVAGKRKGLYVWTCRVALPYEAKYSINNYAPETRKDNGERVPVDQVQEFLIVSVRGAVIPND